MLAWVSVLGAGVAIAIGAAVARGAPFAVSVLLVIARIISATAVRPPNCIATKAS